MKNLSSDRVKKLPLWAQKLINNQQTDIEVLKRKNENLEMVHELLTTKEWFTLKAPIDMKENEYMHVWLLDRDAPRALCSIGKSDIILVGRHKKYCTPIDSTLNKKNKVSKKKIKTKKHSRLPRRRYAGVEFVFKSDIEELHGKEWSDKFAKAFGINTQIMIPPNYPGNSTGENLAGIFYDDYERFADVVDYNKPTYFD